MLHHDFGIVPELIALKDGSAVNMNVDGSSANKTYKFQPGGGEKYLVEYIDFFILKSGATMAHNVFAGLGAGLTNGLKLVAENTIRQNQTERLVVNIQNNADIAMAFPDNRLVGDTTTGFLNEIDYFFGRLKFSNCIYLDGDVNDKIKMVVRDDLTSVDVIRAQVMAWKIL